MEHLQTALEKAEEGQLQAIQKEISKNLVRVYQQIAVEYQEKGEFDNALQFFEKCLDVSQRANDKKQEAECYQKIGMIYEN